MLGSLDTVAILRSKIEERGDYTDAGRQFLPVLQASQSIGDLPVVRLSR